MTEEDDLMSVRTEMTRIDRGKIIADVVVVVNWMYLGQRCKLDVDMLMGWRPLRYIHS